MLNLVDTSKLQLRNLSVNDLDDLMAIEEASFADPWSKEAYLTELDNNLAHYLVCVYGTQLVAYGGFWSILDEGHISNIAVHPDYRHCGFGELLMNALITLCCSTGGQRMTLEARKSNLTAQHLYTKLGFQTVGVRPKYYLDNQEDAVIMWKDLIDLNIS